MEQRREPAMPAGPVGGSAAWTVPQVMMRDDWICRLSDSDVAEIDAAVADSRARGLAITEIERDDFPLDQLTARLGALRAQIRSGSVSAISRGCRSGAMTARRCCASIGGWAGISATR